MKKLFGMIAIVLLFSSVVFAKSKRIDTDILGRDDRPKVTTICIDGYKFVLVGDTLKNAAAHGIVQFYINQNGNVIPATCNM